MVHYCAFELVRSKKNQQRFLGLAVQFVAGVEKTVFFRDDSSLETFLLPIGSMVLVYIVNIM